MIHNFSRTVVTVVVALLSATAALGQGADIPRAITSDENGFVYVAASSVNSLGQTSIVIIAYDADGNLWREFALPADAAGPALAVDIDLIYSMIVVAGTSTAAGTGTDIFAAGFLRPGLLSAEPAPQALSSFTLDQNYPNPLRIGSAATISYEVPIRSDVRLAVMDLLGREVAVLAEGFHEKGSYQTHFAPSSLPSGSYLYVLTSSATSEVRKLILTR